MLSRTADHLYWMARYTERAENIARMLDANYRMSLLPQTGEFMRRGWIATLSQLGLLGHFREHEQPLTDRTAMEFVATSRENPASIYHCMRLARENAHAVRGTLSAETWETVNSTWLEMRAFVAGRGPSFDISEFFEWVKVRSQLTRGVIQGTMLRDEGHRFTMLGLYIERADTTARLLDIKYDLLLPHGEDPAGTADYYQWGALLHSVSAFETYRKVYRDAITPRRVAELLILREDMPRSLRRSTSQIVEQLEATANDQSGETLRRAGELDASLRYARIDDILAMGLHPWLTGFLARIADLGERIAQDFLVPAVR